MKKLIVFVLFLLLAGCKPYYAEEINDFDDVDIIEEESPDDVNVASEELKRVDFDASDPAIAKCIDEMVICAEDVNNDETSPLDKMTVLDMQRFEIEEDANIFFEKYRNPINQPNIANEFSHSWEQTDYGYPMILIGVQAYRVYGRDYTTFIGVCNATGNMLYQTKVNLLCS